jgi:carboxypeptidase Q
MNRRSFLTAAAASALAPVFMPAFARNAATDTLARIRTLGLDPATSEVMKTASYMMDVLGPRLSGSPGILKSGEWVVEKMKGWGLTGAALEAFPNDPTGGNNGFPRGWSNEKFYLHATTPNAFPVTGMSLAWTPGTPGLVSGECVLVTETEGADVRQKYAGKLRGKWVLGQAPADLPLQLEPVARRYTQQELDDMGNPAPPRPAQARPAQNPFDRNAFFRDEGALGILSTNKGHGVINVLGGPRTEAPDRMIPRIIVEAEHYGRIARSLMQGQPVTLEADIRNAWYDKPEMFNVVGEIRGASKPDEVVILGAHFDSFHSATGATDNGGACASMLEAMRLLKAAGAQPARTIRVCLWNAEEQGLIGSRLYVRKHFGGANSVPATPAHGGFQAYFNLDNGAGAIRGIHTQGNAAIAPIFRSWLDPVRDIGATHISVRSTGATDHASFDAAGLPGFQFIQDPLEYTPKTHHTNMDFFERLQPEDMRRNAVILAHFALTAANHPDRLPRKG